MRHALLATFAVVTIALLAPLSMLAGCGKGGGAGMGDPEGARSTLIDVLDAARKDDYAGARPRLDVVEWLAAVEHPMASEYTTLPQDQRDKLDVNCFRAARAVFDLVSLPDQPAIATAVKAGRSEAFPQLKAVTIHFSAPDRENAGRQLPVDAKLRYGIDRTWRLVVVEVDL